MASASSKGRRGNDEAWGAVGAEAAAREGAAAAEAAVTVWRTGGGMDGVGVAIRSRQSEDAAAPFGKRQGSRKRALRAGVRQQIFGPAQVFYFGALQAQREAP